MAHRVIDKRIGSKARGEHFDRREEKLSEYFEADRAERKVLRYELLAILTQIHKAQQNMKWYNRLWRNLTSAVGSKPVPSVEPGDMGVTVKGEPVSQAEIEEQRARLSEEA